jgi:hypothetical protein
MFILASKLGKSTNSLVNPFIAIYLLPARSLGWGNRGLTGLGDNRIDLHLLKIRIINTGSGTFPLSILGSHQYCDV